MASIPFPLKHVQEPPLEGRGAHMYTCSISLAHSFQWTLELCLLWATRNCALNICVQACGYVDPAVE